MSKQIATSLCLLSLPLLGVLLLQMWSRAQESSLPDRASTLLILERFSANDTVTDVKSELSNSGIKYRFDKAKKPDGSYDWVAWTSGLIDRDKSNPRNVTSIIEAEVDVKKELFVCQKQHISLCFVFDKTGKLLRKFPVETSCFKFPEF